MKALLGSYGGAQGRKHKDDHSGLTLKYLPPETLCQVLSIFDSVSMIACAWWSAPIHPSVLSSQRREKALPPAPLQEDIYSSELVIVHMGSLQQSLSRA